MIVNYHENMKRLKFSVRILRLVDNRLGNGVSRDNLTDFIVVSLPFSNDSVGRVKFWFLGQWIVTLKSIG